MKRTLFGICVLAGGLGLFAACSDSPTVVQKNVTPSTPLFDRKRFDPGDPVRAIGSAR